MYSQVRSDDICNSLLLCPPKGRGEGGGGGRGGEGGCTTSGKPTGPPTQNLLTRHFAIAVEHQCAFAILTVLSIQVEQVVEDPAAGRWGGLEGVKGPYLLMTSCKVLLLWVPILPVVAAKVW